MLVFVYVYRRLGDIICRPFTAASAWLITAVSRTTEAHCLEHKSIFCHMCTVCFVHHVCVHKCFDVLKTFIVVTVHVAVLKPYF